MKKVVCLCLAILMCVCAVSCAKKPSIETSVANAETLVENESVKSEYYTFESDFDEKLKVFCVIMAVDEKKVSDLVDDMDAKSEYKPALKTVALNNHDSNESVIKSELNSLKSTLEAMFEGTDVLVECCYVTLDGNVNWY